MFGRSEWNEQQGRVTAIHGAVTDINERKGAEEALRKSEAKFRAVVENSNDGIMFTDKESIIVIAARPTIGSADIPMKI